MGLLPAAGNEVVLAIERGSYSGEECTSAVGDLFEWLHGEALQYRVGLGGVVGISADAHGLLGDPRLRGVAFVPTVLPSGIPLPAAVITAVPLTQSELEAARRYGVVRLMGLLGQRYRHFPTAPWTVRGRPDVTSPDEMVASVLSRTSYVRLSNCCAYVRGIETRRDVLPPTESLDNDRVSFARREVVLLIAAREAAELSRILTEREQVQPLAILCCPDPRADSALVWAPGNSQMNAICLQGGSASRMAGNHVIFVPDQEKDQVKVVEDGFAVLLTNSTWHEIRDLLARGPQNWGMPVVDELAFRLKVGSPDPAARTDRVLRAATQRVAGSPTTMRTA